MNNNETNDNEWLLQGVKQLLTPGKTIKQLLLSTYDDFNTSKFYQEGGGCLPFRSKYLPFSVKV